MNPRIIMPMLIMCMAFGIQSGVAMALLLRVAPASLVPLVYPAVVLAEELLHARP